jgi:hypothetical protein
MENQKETYLKSIGGKCDKSPSRKFIKIHEKFIRKLNFLMHKIH